MTLGTSIKGAGFGLPLFFVLGLGAADDREAASWMAAGAESAAHGDYIRAEASFHKACLLRPKLPDACVYFGRTLYLLDRFEESIKVLRTSLETGPPATGELYRILALSLQASGKADEAEAAYREAMRLPRSPRPDEDPAIDYGVFLYRAGRAEASLEPLRAAASRRPEASRAHLELGCALLALDRLDEAATHLQRATTLDPSNARAHLLLGKTYQRLGKSELAAKELDQGSRTAK